LFQLKFTKFELHTISMTHNILMAIYQYTSVIVTATSVFIYKQAVLSQGEPRDATVSFDTYRILHTTASFVRFPRLSCWSSSADCSELSVKKWCALSTRKNQARSHI